MSACETAQISSENVWGGVAPALARGGMAAVVASQFLLQDQNAIAFTEELYRGVLSGGTVDEAIYEARKSIYNQSGLVNRDWGALTLYLRVEDGIIFPVASSQDGIAQAPASIQPRPPAVDSTTLGGLLGGLSIAVGDNDGSVTGVSIGSVTFGQLTPAPPPPRKIPNVAPTRRQVALIGRNNELNQISAQLQDGCKYYVHGPYGVGKTSLLTELFSRSIEQKDWKGGYLWISAGKLSIEDVLDELAREFAVPEAQGTAERDKKINAIRARLSEQSDSLIALDEVDRPEVALAVLDAAGTCTVMLNGLKPVNFGGLAQQLQLLPLNPGDAALLFLRAANLPRPERPLVPREQELVDLICKRLGYLPLAIELAGSRCSEQGESLELLWERLEEAPASFVGEGAPVRAMFEISYNDLLAAPAALRLLLRLSSFPSMEAPLSALRQGAKPLDFFEAKDKLTQLWLVSTAIADRMALHPLLGLLARAKADEQAIRTEREWVAHYLLKYAQDHEDDYAMLANEHSNLVGLFDVLQDGQYWEELIALMRALFDYLRVRGYWGEAHRGLEATLEAAQTLKRPLDEAYAYLHLGVVKWLQNDMNGAETNFTKAEALYVQEGDIVGRGMVRLHQAVLTGRHDRMKAKEQLEEAVEWMGDKAPIRSRVRARELLANIFLIQGEPNRARKELEVALELSEGANNIESVARVHSSLGYLADMAGEPDVAEEHYNTAAELSEKLGYPLEGARIRVGLGYVFLHRAEYSKAFEAFCSAQEVYKGLHYDTGLALVHYALGNYRLYQKDIAGARLEHQAALEISQRLGDGTLTARTQYMLGVEAQRLGNNEEAKTAYNAALEAATSKELQDVSLRAAALGQLGSIALGTGDLNLALDHATAALGFARQAEERLSEATALALIGNIHVAANRTNDARKALNAALDIFLSLDAPQAARVKEMLEQLDKASNLSRAGRSRNTKRRTSTDVARRGNEIDGVIRGGDTLAGDNNEHGETSRPNIDQIIGGGAIGQAVGSARDYDLDQIVDDRGRSTGGGAPR